MANFQTHLTGGALIASTATFACLQHGLCTTDEARGLFTIGVAASLLPDIDADDAKPVRMVFGFSGVLIGFLVAVAHADRLAPVDLMLIWAGVGLLVRYPLRWLFARWTLHRGSWHSLLMMLVVALAAATLAERFYGQTPQQSWLVGAFALLGYLTHLTLDEIAAVDLTNRRVKRSFGTALKPFSLRAWPASLLLAALLLGLIGISPDPAPLLTALDPLGLPTDRLAACWPRWQLVQ